MAWLAWPLARDTRIFPRPYLGATQATPMSGDPLRRQSSDVALSQHPKLSALSSLPQASPWVADSKPQQPLNMSVQSFIKIKGD